MICDHDRASGDTGLQRQDASGHRLPIADGVDAQIDLASLNYSEPSAVAESTQKLAAFVSKKLSGGSSSTIAIVSTSSTATASSSAISIDQALRELSQ